MNLLSIGAVLITFIGVASGLPSSQLQTGTGQQPMVDEVFDDLWMVDSLDWQGTVLRVGDSAKSVFDAIGGVRDKAFTLKPSHTTAKKLDADSGIYESLRPDMAPVSARFRKLSEQCGESCYVAATEKKLGKKDKARFIFIGTDQNDLHVAAIMIDQGHNSSGAMLRRAFRDAVTGASYVVTEDGTYRISRGVNSVRIEKLK